MLALAWEGITSLSVKPIRIITFIGLISVLISIIMLLVFLIQWICGVTVAGWTSIIFSIWLLGGLQILQSVLLVNT